MRKLMTIVMSVLSAVVTGGAFASVSVTPENCASVLATMTNGETYEFAAGDYPIAATIDLSSVQNVTFVGAGADKTTFLPSSDFSGGFATGTDATNLTVRGIAFSGFKSSVFNLTTIHKLTISACKFLNNSAANGPALYGKDIFDGLVTGSRFEGNTSTSNGGAICLSYASAPREWQDTHLLVKDSVFSGNTAWRANTTDVVSGSAIYAQYHPMTVDNCLFTRNAGHGQVIYFYGWNDGKSGSWWLNGKYEIKNSTIADNYTPIGVTATSRSTQTITNSVIFGQRYPIGIQSGVYQLVDKGDCYWSVQALKRRLDKPAIFFAGADEQVLSAFAAKDVFSGCIGTTDNVIPGHFVKICELAAKGDFGSAAVLQDEVVRLVELLFENDNGSWHKEMMRYVGFDCGSCRAPAGRPLTDGEYAALCGKLEKLGFVAKG